jgi:hypothetical protein
MRGFAGIPGHASRHLHHCNTCLLDQVAVLGQSVWNRDSIAEIGVSHLLPTEHAGDITRVNVPTVHQELTGLADSLLLIGRPGAHADQALINCNRLQLICRGFPFPLQNISFADLSKRDQPTRIRDLWHARL